MLSKLASAAVVDADAFTLPGAVISIPAQQAGAGSPAVRKEALGASLSAASLGTACAFGGFLFAAVARKSGVARRGRCSGQTRACALSGEEFLAGQKVVIVGHPAMHGKAGEIVAPDASGSFKVLFESGSIFSIAADMIQDAATQAAAQAVAAPAPVMPAPVSAAAPSPAPSPAPAPAPAPAPVPAVAAPAVAATEEAELEFTPGQRVVIVGHPVMAGKQGDVVGPAVGNAFAVRFESGSVFNIATDQLQDAAVPVPAAPQPVAATQTAATPVAARATPAQDDDDELEFTPGQRVVVNGPPAMAGKQGAIVGAALGNTFAVQFDSGSIFNIATESIQDAAAPAPVAPASAATAPVTSYAPASAAQDDEELEFTPGQQVVLIGPSAMAGKKGSIVSPAVGNAFAVRFESGSVFNISTENIQDAAAPAPAITASNASATPAPKAVVSSAAQDDDELEFTPGQRVVVNGPPAMAGKKGVVVGPALDNTFAVRFDSGSVFNISTENIQDAAAPAPAITASNASATPAPKAVVSSAAQDDDELEFSPGQAVALLGPPAMFGKRATVVGPALNNTFKVRLESGSVFNIKTDNLQDAAMPMPAAPATPPPAPEPVAAAPAASPEAEVEYSPGQKVVMLSPPAMAGKPGTIVGPAVGGNFAVQFESGSIFNFAPENMQDAAAPMPTTTTPINVTQLTELSLGQDEEELPIGTGVVVVAGHAMAQRRGTVVEHPAGDSSAVAVRFESGSVFYIAKSSVRCKELA
eukprot:TRINITY_DN2216_c0_g1_i1.p1 TRINITY_DN2216_c0_g1~~TRINITY_DN2216_c0_g1_i1.p1  ORF type:complete len:755 (+),score=222.29 TRINITY_DN2216_c0_g1_i1:82-2346(+)